MTSKKSLKERVRERQAKTGERYTTALMQVRATAPPTVEEALHEVTRAAQLEGFTCRAFASDELWRAESSLGAPEERFRGVLARLRALLLALDAGDAGASLAGLLLRGEASSRAMPNHVQELVAARQFLSKARAGVRGVSANARLVVLDVPRGEAQAPVLGVVLAAPGITQPLLALSPLKGEGAEPTLLGRLFEEQLTLAGMGGWAGGA
jgi:hypothetical protein